MDTQLNSSPTKTIKSNTSFSIENLLSRPDKSTTELNNKFCEYYQLSRSVGVGSHPVEFSDRNYSVDGSEKFYHNDRPKYGSTSGSDSCTDELMDTNSEVASEESNSKTLYNNYNLN